MITRSEKKDFTKITKSFLNNFKVYLEKNPKDSLQYLKFPYNSDDNKKIISEVYSKNKLKHPVEDDLSNISRLSNFDDSINLSGSETEYLLKQQICLTPTFFNEHNQEIKLKVPLTSNNFDSINKKSLKTILDCPNQKKIKSKIPRIHQKHKDKYEIVYYQNFSGIKKRNTPDEERKKYVINIQNIVDSNDTRTTLMIKNIPNNVTQVDLLKIINKKYSQAYNFFYLPIDFNKKSNAGYAFINFKSSKLIINFFLDLEGKIWDLPNCGNKICYLSYARIQGFRSICEHFSKSSIMKQVDEKVKPIIISK
jgi:hypothetical protein